jgi:hypothetical protein
MSNEEIERLSRQVALNSRQTFISNSLQADNNAYCDGIERGFRIGAVYVRNKINEETKVPALEMHDIAENYINAIKLADKIINGDTNTYGMVQCLDHYYNGAFDEDLLKLQELKSKVGL